MRKWLVRASLVGALCGVFLLGVVVYAQNTPKRITATSTQASVHAPTRDELLALVNAERQKVGAKPLVMDARLNESAQAKADDMQKNNYFGHVDSTGMHGYVYIQQKNIVNCYPTENLTQNTSINDSMHAVTAWLNSPPHKAAMLKNATYSTGFGIAGNYVVEHFCSPL